MKNNRELNDNTLKKQENEKEKKAWGITVESSRAGLSRKLCRWSGRGSRYRIRSLSDSVARACPALREKRSWQGSGKGGMLSRIIEKTRKGDGFHKKKESCFKGPWPTGLSAKPNDASGW